MVNIKVKNKEEEKVVEKYNMFLDQLHWFQSSNQIWRTSLQFM